MAPPASLHPTPVSDSSAPDNDTDTDTRGRPSPFRLPSEPITRPSYPGGRARSDVAFAVEPDPEPTSPTAPLAPYPPPLDARSRAPEFYGFVAWTGTYLLFALYLLWALLPDAAIRALGVAWYPNREWSLLIPAYGMVLVLLTYFSYLALARAGTPAFSDPRTITGSKAHLPPVSPAPAAADDANEPKSKSESESESAPTHTPNPKRNPYVAHAAPGAVPELYDIPLGLVNRVVYARPPPPPSS